MNVGNRIIELPTSIKPENQAKAAEISLPTTHFQNLVEDLFSETGKKILRQSNEIQFEQDCDILTPYHLSSGEKQMLLILTTVFLQEEKPNVVLMDEPEISLHISWQDRLIEWIRQLNPYCQVILTTHSPNIFANGWEDKIVFIQDLERP